MPLLPVDGGFTALDDVHYWFGQLDDIWFGNCIDIAISYEYHWV